MIEPFAGCRGTTSFVATGLYPDQPAVLDVDVDGAARLAEKTDRLLNLLARRSPPLGKGGAADFAAPPSLTSPAGSGCLSQDVNCIIIAVDPDPITSLDLGRCFPSASNTGQTIVSGYNHGMG